VVLNLSTTAVKDILHYLEKYGGSLIILSPFYMCRYKINIVIECYNPPVTLQSGLKIESYGPVFRVTFMIVLWKLYCFHKIGWL